MKKIAGYLLVLAIVAGCKKTDKIDPITTGSLSGTILPATAVTQITATASGGKTSYLIAVNPVTGKFSLADMEEAAYLLSFDTDAKYEKIADKITTVTAGKNFDLGIVHTKETVNPVPQNVPSGSLSGSIVPIGAVASISIYSEGAIGYVRMYRVPLDPATGKFSLANIPEGNYWAYMPAVKGFNNNDQIYFKITADKNTDLGAINFTVTTEVPVGYTLSCNVNGQPNGWMLTGSYLSPNLTIAAFSVWFSPGQPSAIVYKPAIMLKGVNGPGTYVCNKSTGNQILYYAYRAPSGWATIQSTSDAGSEGTVTITSIDRVNRIIKGTFSANLAERPGEAGADKIITNGIINAKY